MMMRLLDMTLLATRRRAVLTGRPFVRLNLTVQKQPDANAESGSVFTVLPPGIAMAAALSFVLYQTVSGPISSMVRVEH